MRKTRFYATCVRVNGMLYDPQICDVMPPFFRSWKHRYRAHFLLGKLFSNVLYLMICSPTKTLDKVIWPIRYGANWNIIRYTWTKVFIILLSKEYYVSLKPLLIHKSYIFEWRDTYYFVLISFFLLTDGMHGRGEFLRWTNSDS